MTRPTPEVERARRRAAGRRRGPDHRRAAVRSRHDGGGVARVLAPPEPADDLGVPSSARSSPGWSPGRLLVGAADPGRAGRAVPGDRVGDPRGDPALAPAHPRPGARRLAAGPRPPRPPRRPARPAARLHPLAGAAVAAAGVRRGGAGSPCPRPPARSRCWSSVYAPQGRLRVDPLPRCTATTGRGRGGTAQSGATTASTTTRTSTTGSPSPAPAPPTGCSAPTPTRPRSRGEVAAPRGRCTLAKACNRWRDLAGRSRATGRADSVEPRGLEPLTPCLQSRCATNCAKAPGGRER